MKRVRQFHLIREGKIVGLGFERENGEVIVIPDRNEPVLTFRNMKELKSSALIERLGEVVGVRI